MTRFEQELSGALGAYWKASAEKELADIRESRRRNGYSPEELHEMRAAFGPGATVVNILTGETITC